MPINDTSGDFAKNAMGLLQVFAQLKQLQDQRQTSQADASIARVGPGATIAQAGLTPKQQKAKYGRVMAGTELASPDSPENKASKLMLARIDSMTPEDLDQFTATMQNKMTGTPGVATGASLRSVGRVATSEGQTAETKAKTTQAVQSTLHTSIMEGLSSIAAAPKDIQAGIGLKAAGITSPEAEASERLAGSIKAETQRMALKVLADPKHPLNAVMKENLGFNAITAAGGIALGLGNLMDETARVAFDRANLGKQTELLKLGALLDQDKQMNQAEAEWAKTVATSMGGTVTPRAVLNWKRWKEGGGVKGAMPRGVTDQMDATLSAATAIQQRAMVTEAAQKGDPYANQLMNLIQSMGRISNSNTLKAVADISNQYFGKIQAATLYGPRPLDDPNKAAQWDAAAAAIAAKMPKLDTNWFITGGGVDVQMPKPPNPMGAGIGGQTPQSVPPVPPGALNLMGPAAAGQISPEDLATIQQLMQAISGAGATPVLPPKPPGAP